MVKLILAAHGNLAREMLETAAKIIPFDSKNIQTISVSGRVDFAILAANLKTDIDAQNGTLILTDLFGGSACNLCVSAAMGVAGVNVLSGLNLSMLISALTNRGVMGGERLAAKVLEDGQKSIVNATQKGYNP